MLPAAARLTRSEDFRLVTRRGRRVARPRIVVHALRSDRAQLGQALLAPRVGLVVGKAVGNSVVRHRVSRRIRHVVRDWLGTIPPGTSLVVRALPSAAQASSADFRTDLDAALRQLRLTANDNGGAA